MKKEKEEKKNSKADKFKNTQPLAAKVKKCAVQGFESFN